MIDWTTVFEEARPEPGASQREIATFLGGLGQPLSAAEIAEVNRFQRNPFSASDPHHATWAPFDPSGWQMPDRPVPASYVSFLRWSDGGTFRNGDRYFQMYGTGLRQMMIDRNIPQYMPRALPFAFNGGGVMYMFDMRKKAIKGEYPIICASAGCLTFDPHYSPRVANSFLEVCQGRFNVERLRFGGIVLTEDTWPTCADPNPMLDECRHARKLRLFACACCRRIWHLLPEKRFRHSVEVAERYADNEATDRKRQTAKEACKKARGTPLWTAATAAATEASDQDASQAASSAASSAAFAEAGNAEGTAWVAARAWQADLLREIFGNPFRPVTIAKSWLAYNDGAVPKIARSIYDGRDFDQMGILADALEEAGCTNSEILAHCRQRREHIRGCWVLDLLLGVEEDG
jgi:hypothetical protein